MAPFIDDTEWAEYEDDINDFHNDAFQQSLIWHRTLLRLDVNGNDSNPTTKVPITLKCLIQYNHFRSWPISKESIPGQIDAESVLVFINVEYLKREGFTNIHNQFKYDPGLDRFEIDGIMYVDKGNSKTAQTKDKTLLHFLVLKREEIETGNNMY